jgi:hypothetical protein
MAPQLLMPLIMAPLMLFGVWRRIRRTFGPQPIQRKRMMLRIGFLALAGVLIGSLGLVNLLLLEGLLGGVAIGVVLGLLGLNLTRFERNAAGADVYIPNPWIGGLLTVLLLGRLIWRFAVLGTQAGASVAPTAPQLGNSPLTLLLVGLMIGYYVAYYSGLLIHHRRFEQEQLARGVKSPEGGAGF